jgi:hypothetical protein
MNVFLLLFVLLLTYSFINFRRAFLLFALFTIISNQNLNLVNIPGVPLLSLRLSGTFFFAIRFFLLREEFREDARFPLKMGYAAVALSFLLSTLFSTQGITASLTRALQYVFQDLVFTYMFWRIIRDDLEITFFLKGLFALFLCLFLYGFFEKLFIANPIMEYEQALNASGAKVVNWAYSEESRLGMGRVQSLVAHAIGYGCWIVLFLSILRASLGTKRMVWKPSLITVSAMSCLAIISLFFTNSRGPLLFCLIAFLPLANPRRIYTYIGLAFVFVGLMLIRDQVGGYLVNLVSIFDADTAEDVGGSSTDMRLAQLGVALSFWQTNPLLGLGVKAMDAVLEMEVGLLGGESIWFFLLVERGIVGCLAFMVLLFSVFRMIPRSVDGYWIKFLALGWLAVSTATTTPGCDLGGFLAIALLMHRLALAPEPPGPYVDRDSTDQNLYSFK